MKKYLDKRFLTDELAQKLFPSEDFYQSEQRLINYVKALEQIFEGSGQHMPPQSALSTILNELNSRQLDNTKIP